METTDLLNFLVKTHTTYPKTYMSQILLGVSSQSEISKSSCGAIPPTFHVLTKTLNLQSKKKKVYKI
jgi:hypothetical protein